MTSRSTTSSTLFVQIAQYDGAESSGYHYFEHAGHLGHACVVSAGRHGQPGGAEVRAQAANRP